jgi:hypothetical protein
MSTCQCHSRAAHLRTSKYAKYLLGVTVGLHRLHTSLASLVVLEALLRRLMNSALAGDDLLDGGENVAPVLKDGERHVLTCAVGDEVWRALVGRIARKQVNGVWKTDRGPSWRRGDRSRGRRRGQRRRRLRRRG